VAGLKKERPLLKIQHLSQRAIDLPHFGDNGNYRLFTNSVSGRWVALLLATALTIAYSLKIQSINSLSACQQEKL
jgi:hypothetical protein